MGEILVSQKEEADVRRCDWASPNPGTVEYHDTEWGVPTHDDRTLFELLILEGAQAGLSWDTILKKRESYRLAFDGFDAAKVAGYGEHKVADLLSDPGIVRNRLKVAAAVQNARSFLQVQSEFGSFDAYIWSFIGGRPKKNAWTRMEDLPAKTLESEAMSRDLRKRGFKFVGPTICYAYMQSIGMVNDHQVDCFRYLQVS